MKKVLLATILLLVVIRMKSFAQAGIFNPNDAVLNYNAVNPPATPPANTIAKWFRTPGLSWNTDKFKAYYYNDMVFRVRFPNGYNAADTAKKYPVILFFHGGGEVAPISDNELQLINGAEQFQGLIDNGQFNAFMVYPQQKILGWDYSYMTRINNVLDSLQKYCHTDPDRVISMGLSAGGYGAMLYSIAFSQRASTTIAASPALIDILTQDPASFVHIPFWLSSGGTDANPNPTVTQNFVDSFTNKGGKIRYNFYPTLGHATWDEQWEEPYLVPTWQAAHKANPVVYFNRTKFISAATITAKIGITPGFAQYQWQKDSVDLAGATTNDILPTQFGKYRVRFKRTAGSNWSDWSPVPIVISQDNIAPSIPLNLKSLFSGRTIINLDWNNATDNDSVARYDIYVNGVKKYTSGESAITADNLLPNTSYVFTIKALDQAGNTSDFSSPITASTTTGSNGLNYRYYEGNWPVLPNFNALTPIKTGVSPNTDLTKRNTGVNDLFSFVWEGYINIKTPGTYTFETISDDGSKLYFNSFYSPVAKALVNNDGLHEAWPRSGSVNIPTAGPYPIAITYFDQWNSETMQLYWTGPGFGRSLIPDSVFSDSPISSPDNIAPTVPTNLKLVNTGASFVELDWDNSTDNIAVTGYDIYVDSVKKYSSNNSNIVAGNLLPNTTYKFMVKALDNAGNASGFSAAISVTTIASASGGLTYKYYEGSWSQLPDLSTLTPIKTGKTANIDITVRTPGVNDNFAFVWEGNLNIPTAGQYYFQTISDDGSKFYFNTFYSPSATALVNNDGLHASQMAGGTLTVPAPGLYPVSITYFEGGGGESVQLYWTGPGIATQLVPNSAFAESTPNADAIAPTVPANVVLVNAGASFVDLDWDNSIDNVAVTGYEIYFDNVKKYSSSTSNITANNLLPNTTYSVTVKALDQAGNMSGFSTALSVTTTSGTSGGGLKYKYYEGNWPQLPNFNTLIPVKTGTTPNIDITVRTAGVNDLFGFVWEGNINITNPGTYTFETVSDDGSKFYFNTLYSPTATALVNNDGLHPSQTVAGTVNIPTAGSYPVAISFFESGGGESMQLYWTGPGITRQLVPNSAFAETITGDVTVPSVPANLKSLNTGNSFVTLDWDNATDNIGVASYDIYVNNIKRYTSAESSITATALTPNTAYTFTVKAIDQSGNTSAASNAVTVTTTSAASGLQYRYYQGNWNALPNFNLLTPVKSGSTPNIDIVTPRNRNDSFGFVWEGHINISIAGTYTFETVSDDGSKLYFNTFYSPSATALISNDGLHGQTSVSATINITNTGLYPIAITFFEKYDGESMQVYWSGPGIPRQLIPNAAFTNPSSDIVAPSAPEALKVNYTGRTFSYLSWQKSTDNVGVTGYDIYVNNVKKYTVPENQVTIDKLVSGSSNAVYVRALDLAGNASAASTAITVSTTSTTDGLFYRYYEGSWDVLPNFNNLTPVRTGTTPNIDIGIRTPGVNDRFAFVWEGLINLQTIGTYTFELVSDDGSKLFIGSFYSPTAPPSINDDGLHGPTTVSANINVTTAGLYPITALYFEKDDGETMQLYITGPGIPRQLVTNSAFINTNPGAVTINSTTTQTGFAAVSAEIQVMIEATEQLSLKAYPNPVSEWLNIAFKTSSQKNDIVVDVFDINGKVVYRSNFKGLPYGNNTVKMNIGNQNLSPGIYFVKVHLNGIPSKVIKLVKSRK